MAAASIADAPGKVTIGVDTHKHTHLAVAKDELGRGLGQQEVSTNAAGYSQLLSWAQSFGKPLVFGIEGTNSFGAGLTRFLRTEQVAVLEVLRPARQDRRRRGKSDAIDAEAAAVAVLAGKANAVPKAGDPRVEMLRTLRTTKATAVKARTQAIVALKDMVMTSPDALRDRLRDLSTRQLVTACSKFRIGQVCDSLSAYKLSMRSLAIRYRQLDQEISKFENELDRLTLLLVPQLRRCFGVGEDIAAALVLAAGDNPDRLHSEAAFSMLCGASPIPASSGLTRRHRLNRGGDRQANAALHRIVLVRLRWHEPTRVYMERRVAEGKSKKEVIRCLKRYVAREIFGLLRPPGRVAADGVAA